MLEQIATDCIAVRVVKVIYDEALRHHGLRISPARVQAGTAEKNDA
jgi:hypothetical protein